MIDLNLALVALGVYGTVNLIVGIIIGRWVGHPTPPTKRKTKG